MRPGRNFAGITKKRPKRKVSGRNNLWRRNYSVIIRDYRSGSEPKTRLKKKRKIKVYIINCTMTFKLFWTQLQYTVFQRENARYQERFYCTTFKCKIAKTVQILMSKRSDPVSGPDPSSKKFPDRTGSGSMEYRTQYGEKPLPGQQDLYAKLHTSLRD